MEIFSMPNEYIIIRDIGIVNIEIKGINSISTHKVEIVDINNGIQSSNTYCSENSIRMCFLSINPSAPEGFC